MAAPRIHGRLRATLRIGAIAASIAAAGAGPVHAHHAPAETIARLSREIADSGASADLLYRRAVEFRILDELDAADDDLSAAITMDPGHLSARLERARVLGAMNRHDEAVDAARTAKSHARNDRERAFCAAQEAIALARAGRHGEASALFAAAVADVPAGEIDWYLEWSNALEVEGRWAERVDVLADGWERTRSAALHRAWIDALLDAGRLAQALPLVEEEIETSRLRGRWWIRRARIHLQSGAPGAAREDLDAALAELRPRIHPTRPSPALLADLALALMLLDRTDEAAAPIRRLEQSVEGRDLADRVRTQFARTVVSDQPTP